MRDLLTGIAIMGSIFGFIWFINWIGSPDTPKWIRIGGTILVMLLVCYLIGAGFRAGA